MHLTLICLTTKYGAKICIKYRENRSSCFFEGKKCCLFFLLQMVQHAKTLVLLMKTSKKPTSKLQKLSGLQKIAQSTHTVETKVVLEGCDSNNSGVSSRNLLEQLQLKPGGVIMLCVWLLFQCFLYLLKIFATYKVTNKLP